MTLHSEILFLEIIKLYFKNNSNPLPLKNLKNAFYTLLEIISIKERKKYYFNFNEALAHFKDIAEDYINIDNESLFLREETEMLESLILEHLNSNFSSLDYDIEEYIHNIAMYKVLNITIPLDKTKDLFNLNRKIMDTIYKIAELEITEKPNNNEIDSLKELLRDIYSNFQTIALDELTDIKMCCAYYNFLANTTDTSWQIALFSNNPAELSSLATKLIEFIYPELELKLKNGEEDINEIFDNELIILLINLLLSLNLYLKNNKNSPGYEELTHRKYLLLALPDLKAILDYFLSNKTIDDLKLPHISTDYITTTSFEHLKPFILKCLSKLKYSDQEITSNPHLYAKTVINILFIKAFLTYSINTQSKKQIEFLLSVNITNNNPKYSITQKLLNELLIEELKLLK